MMDMVVYIRKADNKSAVNTVDLIELRERIAFDSCRKIRATYVQGVNKNDYDFSEWGLIIICEINENTNQIILKFTKDVNDDTESTFPILDDSDHNYDYKGFNKRALEMKKKILGIIMDDY